MTWIVKKICVRMYYICRLQELGNRFLQSFFVFFTEIIEEIRKNITNSVYFL